MDATDAGDAEARDGDAEAGDAGGADADADAGALSRCDHTKPFKSSALVPLDFGSSQLWSCAALSGNETELFVTNLDGVPLRATRLNTTEPFGALAPVDGITGPYSCVRQLSADRLRAYGDIGSGQVTARSAVGLGFGVVGTLASYPAYSGGLWALSDETVIYFENSPTHGPFDTDLYRATVTGGIVGTPELVPGVNSTGEGRIYPVVSDDELVIYFSIYENETVGQQVYMSTRASKEVAFSAPAPVPELNSVDSDVPSWISPDGCVLYSIKGRSLIRSERQLR